MVKSADFDRLGASGCALLGALEACADVVQRGKASHLSVSMLNFLIVSEPICPSRPRRLTNDRCP